MTKRIYYSSDNLTMTTRVVECSPIGDGMYHVILAETLFHPQGGGQLSDKGRIAGVNVEGVLQVGDKVVHITEQDVACGDAFIEVLPEVRTLNARLHSAGHLISGVVEQMGWRATKGHHWPGEGRVVFVPGDNAQPPTAETVEQTVNQLISDDVPRHLAESDGVRSVCFGNLPMHNCGGTHVKSAGMVGRIKILKLKEKKGELSIQYDLES